MAMGSDSFRQLLARFSHTLSRLDICDDSGEWYLYYESYHLYKDLHKYWRLDECQNDTN